MSYQPMPSAPPPGPPGSKGPAPSTVVLAVRLMFTNVALQIIGLIVVVTTKDSIRDQITSKNENKSTADIDSLVNTAITIAVVIAIIFAVLYVLLALQVGKGKNWARIVTWVFAGLGVLGALSSLGGDTTGLSKTLSLVGGLIDLAIIILLAQKASHPYFRKPQYGPPPGYGGPPPGYGPPQGGYGPPQQGGYNPPQQGGGYGPPPGYGQQPPQ